MNPVHLLDPLADGSFVPYRDENGQIRLQDGSVSIPQLDIPVPGRGSGRKTALRKNLTKLLRAAEAAAANVKDEQSYRKWYSDHAEPFINLAHESRGLLGGCMGDEGDEWYGLSYKLTGSVHRPGWRVE